MPRRSAGNGVRRVEGIPRVRALAGQWRSRKVEGRAVIVEALVHVGAVLQVLPEQVDLAVARRRVKGHGAPRQCLATRLSRMGPGWAERHGTLAARELSSST